MSAYKLSFKSAKDLLAYCRDESIQYIDFNFTDMRGKWHHIAQHVSAFSHGEIQDGVCFDGSSIAGWKSIEQSDMIIKPDLARAALDPFSSQKTLKLFCDVYDPVTQEAYALDPRGVAKKAEAYLKATGIADVAYMGPEPEFFVFENVTVTADSHHVAYAVDSVELPHNSGREYNTGNMGHRPTTKGGYVPESPVDSLSDIRAEMLTVLESVGVAVEKHHHEVAPAQCELGIKYAALLDAADNVQLYKHVVHNVAHSYGKTATFMPKPLNGDNGSGMHVHQSLWKGQSPLFAGDEYAGLSETALFYIGGILKHARALNAFTNPTTNSYRRLVPGYEAPALLSYSARNRSAACRIPHGTHKAAKRVEFRVPDPTANPYLAFAAMMMAGLDGIENKIHPGDAAETDLYDSSAAQGHDALCRDLREALQALQDDHAFLLRGDVFSAELIAHFVALKSDEIMRYETTTHPVEFAMYYST